MQQKLFRTLRFVIAILRMMSNSKLILSRTHNVAYVPLFGGAARRIHWKFGRRIICKQQNI